MVVQKGMNACYDMYTDYWGKDITRISDKADNLTGVKYVSSTNVLINTKLNNFMIYSPIQNI